MYNFDYKILKIDNLSEKLKGCRFEKHLNLFESDDDSIEECSKK